MIRRPPRSTPLYSSAASDVYKRQVVNFWIDAACMPRSFPDFPRNHLGKNHLFITKPSEYLLVDDSLKRVEDFRYLRAENPLSSTHSVLNPLTLFKFLSRIESKMDRFLWAFPDQLPIIKLCSVEFLFNLLFDKTHDSVRYLVLYFLFANQKL